jgi:hypothetical protein
MQRAGKVFEVLARFEFECHFALFDFHHPEANQERQRRRWYPAIPYSLNDFSAREVTKPSGSITHGCPSNFPNLVEYDAHRGNPSRQPLNTAILDLCAMHIG